MKRMADMYRPPTVESLAYAKGFDPEFLRRRFGLSDRLECPPDFRGIVIPFRDARCNVVATKLRRHDQFPEGKFLILNGEIGLYGLAWHHAKQPQTVVLVEGESDVWTFVLYGIPVLGVPGAAAYGKIQAADVAFLKAVVICREPGKGGRTFEAGILRRLATLNWSGRAITVPFGSDKDPNALHLRCQKESLDFRSEFSRMVEVGIDRRPWLVAFQEQSRSRSAGLKGQISSSVQLPEAGPGVWDPFPELYRLLADFEPRRGSGYFTARCPVHDDLSPSLWVKEKEPGRVIVRCFSGCEVAKILDALGIGWRHLTRHHTQAPARRERRRK